MIKLLTANPVAIDSLDHIKPDGSKNDNTICPEYVEKIIRLFGVSSHLDLGCAGGGLVKEFVDKKFISIGLEGSDYNLKNKNHEWATIPDHLFTCDITRPFFIYYDFNNCFYDVKFKCISAWEVLEHICENDLPTLFKNVRYHLDNFGIFVGSISLAQGEYHNTIKHPLWWKKQFLTHGLIIRPDLIQYFHPDWPRGPLQKPDRGSPKADQCLHYVASKIY